MEEQIKLPPHNIDAEENVIASLLIDGDLIDRLDLNYSDFYIEQNAVCYKACLSLRERGVSINAVTLAQELTEKSAIKVVGGKENILRLISNCATSLDCEYYADIVKRLSIYRQMIVAGDRITTIGYMQSPDMSESLNQADDLILKLRKMGIGSTIITPTDRADIMLEKYNNLRNMESGAALPTGIHDLDEQIGGGLYRSEMVVVGARPGLGKTTFLSNISNTVGDSGKVVLYCSAEMNIDSLTDRDIASVVGIPTNQLRRGGWDDSTFDRIINALNVIHERNVYTLHEKPFTTSKILQEGIKVQSRYGLDLIVVDYLQLLDDNYGNSQYERIGYISRKLKQIAMKLDVPILVATQLNRAVETRQDKRPQLSDLRDSGRIEEDADLVLFLYRDSYYEDDADDKVEILIAKQRQGDSHLIVNVYFDKLRQRYRDLYVESETTK